MPDELKPCEKCGGAGWLWSHELDELPWYPTNSAYLYGMPDDTKYSCDGPAHRRAQEQTDDTR